MTGSRPSSGKANIINGHSSGADVGMNLSNGSQNRHENAQFSDPPLLKRGVTTDEYNSGFNLHHNYQDRRGHIKVPYEQSIRYEINLIQCHIKSKMLRHILQVSDFYVRS